VRDLAVLFVHLIATVAKLLGRGGARSVVANSLLLKHQLLILNRSRERAPKPSMSAASTDTPSAACSTHSTAAESGIPSLHFGSPGSAIAALRGG